MLELKRMVDLAVAGTAALVTAPLLALLATAVKADSPGPAFYVQTRVGKHGRPIRVPKLRTMTVDADRRGPQVTRAGDPRITRVGAILRRTKLDELPQLWAVLRGDMSLVGPRPEVPRYVERYDARLRALLDVRPGITDPASLAFRHEEQLLALARDRERAYTEVIMPLKLALALEGVEQSSVLADLGVLARTALLLLPLARPEHPFVHEARRRIHQLEFARAP